MSIMGGGGWERGGGAYPCMVMVMGTAIGGKISCPSRKTLTT